MNPFESGAQKAIPAVLVYVTHGSRFLMLHRIGPKQSSDIHSQKYNGLGGKLELGESPLQAAVRETREESGLQLGATQFRPLGMIQFPNFKPKKNEDWLVWLYRAEVLDHQLLPNLEKQTDEGKLVWVEQSQLLSLHLWEGDRYFLTHVIESRPISATFWYHEGQLQKHELHLL